MVVVLKLSRAPRTVGLLRSRVGTVGLLACPMRHAGSLAGSREE
jgi:hypothetical protein